MLVLGYQVGLAECMIIAGVLVILYEAFAPKKLSPGAFVLCLAILIGGGALLGGYIDLSGEVTDADPGDDGGIFGTVTEDLNGMIYAKNKESLDAISGIPLYMYPLGTTLAQVQCNRVSPIRPSDANTDSSGKTIFSPLNVGEYLIVCKGTLQAFDGTDYFGGLMKVHLSGVSEIKTTSDCWFKPNTLYLKKLSDPYYALGCTTASMTNGNDQDGSVTEAGAANGTVITLTLRCETDEAWLTDEGYITRVYLSGTYTGTENTATTLADCRTGESSNGDIILKDLTGNHYIDVTSPVWRNTENRINEVWTTSLWVPDLGEVTTTADTFAITFKLSLVSYDTSGYIILQDTGVTVTITCADDT